MTGEVSLMKKEKELFYGLDLLKFICAALVMYLHNGLFNESTGVLQEANFWIKEGICRIAVPEFFIISGFLLFKNGGDSERIKSYTISTIRRYLIWTAIYSPLIIIGICANENGVISGLLSFLHSFVMTGSYVQFWYLRALFISVILFSILYRFIGKKGVLIFSSLGYFCGLALSSYERICGLWFEKNALVHQGINVLKRVIIEPRDSIFYGLLFFSVGALAGMKYNNHKSLNYNKRIIVMTGAFSWVMLLVEIYLVRRFNFGGWTPIYFSLVPVSYCLFIAAISFHGKAPYTQYLVFRKMSMWMFYLHTFVNFFTWQILRRLGLITTTVSSSAIFAAVIVLWLSYLAIKYENKYSFVKKVM